MSDLNELAEAAAGERRYISRRRIAQRLTRLPSPSASAPRRAVASGPRERTPFQWGLGIGLGLIVAAIAIGFVVGLVAYFAG